MTLRQWIPALAAVLAGTNVFSRAEDATPPAAEALAARVVIYRDAWGTPHVLGQDVEAVVFGYGYVQAEDYFPQLEDLYLLALGRYAEVHGPRGLNSDLLNRAFRVVPQAQEEYHRLPPEKQRVLAAFVQGINHYLQTHPGEVRRLERFEPWYPIAFSRHVALELLYRYTDLHHNYLPRMNPRPVSFTGSNAWAVAPSRTASGRALLAAMPHQPLFGFGQLYEVHLMCKRPEWNFSGVGFLGGMLPAMGHNEHLGWAFTTNEPDVGDVWRVVFDRPRQPLRYRYAGGHRSARQWTETIDVLRDGKLQQQRVVLRATHHGPIVGREDEQTYLAVRLAGVMDSRLMEQTLAMIQARNWQEFYRALQQGHYPLFNVVYADAQGNIAYLYNGRIPRRDPRFDWRKVLDGSDPRTQWRGFHAVDELPLVWNPPAGYVQNCNNSPFFTTEKDNPHPDRFPAYMFRDADWDLRRAKQSRRLLGKLSEATFEQMCRLVFDTEMYWARHELPRYRRHFARLQQTHPQLARRVKPLLDHLLAWDGRCTPNSTAATLCEAWYRVMHGLDYPGEEMLEPYRGNPVEQFRALVLAARQLRFAYGHWKVPWRRVFRQQRPDGVVPDLLALRFDDARPSLPALGVPGPLGAVFTHYYTPPSLLGGLFPRLGPRRRYAVVGTSYIGVYEFGPEGVRGATLVQFGASGRAESPHFFDQARLLVQGRLKPELFTREAVTRQARFVYRPGNPWQSNPLHRPAAEEN